MSPGKRDIEDAEKSLTKEIVSHTDLASFPSSLHSYSHSESIYASLIETIEENDQNKRRIDQSTGASGSRGKQPTGLVFHAKSPRNLEGFRAQKLCFFLMYVIVT